MDSSTNETPVLSYSSSVASDEIDDALADIDTIDETDTSEPGQQLACCWLNNSWTASDLLLGGGSAIGGLVTIGAGFFNPGGKPEDATTSIVAFACMGSLLLLLGLGILLCKLLMKTEGIEVTEEGIEWIKKRNSYKYRWNEIDKVLVSEFTATRFSETETTCQLQPVQGKKFGFQTSYLGDPQQVLACILTSCDYIVRNPEGYSKNVK